MSRTIGGQTTWGNNSETWAQVDPTLGPLTGSTWAVPALTTDLEARLLDDPSVGQGVSVGPVSSGTLRFVVQALNPTAATDSLWGTALWGTGVWSASVGAWQDLSARVRSVTWNNGTNGPNTKAVVGLATVVLENIDGAVSSWATTGAFIGNNSTSWIRTGLLIRFGVIRTAALAAGLPALDTFSAFFTGKVETAIEDTDPDQVDGWVTLTLTETTVDNATNLPPDQAVNDGRKLSATIMDTLTSASWPYQTALTVPGEDTVVPDATLTGSSAAARLDLLTDGMHWDWVADGRGRIIIVRRHLSDTDSGVTFANKPTGTQIPAVKVTTYSSVERLINAATATRVASATPGAPVTSEDTRSMARFGVITTAYGFPRSDLILQTDAEVLALNARVVGLRAWDDLGIATIGLDLDQDAVNLPAILTYLACRARESITFTVVYTHPSGAVITELVVVDGQTHTVTPMGAPGTQLKWTATLNTGHAGPTFES